MDFIVISILAVFFCLGLLIQMLFRRFVRANQTRQAKVLAEQIKEDAQIKANEMIEEAKQRAEDYKEQAQAKYEEDIKSKLSKIDEMRIKIEEVDERYSQVYSDRQAVFDKKRHLVDRFNSQVQNKDSKFQQVKTQHKNLQAEYILRLTDKSNADVNELKSKLITKIENDAINESSKFVQLVEEEATRDAEKNARKNINIALNRFARPYCPERGINYVNLIDERTRDRVFGPDKINIQLLEKACGVDLIYREDMNSISVSGFDPVRRELARSSLERLLKERRINEHVINKTVSISKKNLFKKIRNDGHRTAKELKVRGLSQEIKDMMGALRFRYSFAQNQYFHCQEVGHLCGLLSAEIGVPAEDGRRTGLLHDIGKAMDHSLDGGHAVIGADFIEKQGEKEHIVHAVRAHHYDETPSTNLAFLVIGADAISGARPGARRSTADSYMQKMGQLELIGNSFDGVIDTFIMSAGREVRIVVDSIKVDDNQALDLSKKIADKIEDECSYPGLIKVTVVRQTEAVEMAK